MNYDRRKKLHDIISRIDTLQSDAESIAEDLEAIKDEEDEYIDNIPENLQSSELYGRLDALRKKLETRSGARQDIPFETIIDSITEAIEA